MRSETNGHLQVQVPTIGGDIGANYALTREFVTFQGLKNHEPEFGSDFIRLNEKGAPYRSLQPITSSLPKTWHVLIVAR